MQLRAIYREVLIAEHLLNFRSRHQLLLEALQKLLV